MSSSKTSPLLTNNLLYKGEDVDDARETLSTMFTEVDVEPLTGKTLYETLVNGILLKTDRSIFTG